MFRTTDIKIREHDPRSYEINSSPRDFAGQNTAQIMKPDPAGVEEARFRNARALAAFSASVAPIWAGPMERLRIPIAGKS